MHLLKQIIFQARQREDDPAVATSAAVISYRTLSKSIGAAVGRLQGLGLPPGAVVKIDVAHPLHPLYLIIASGLLGLTTASILGGVGMTGGGPPAAMLLTDGEAPAGAAAASARVDDGWFATDPRVAPDYAALLALPGYTGPDTLARLLFSSGTTGYPKCVGLTAATLERRVLENALSLTGGSSPRGATLNLMGMSTIGGSQSAINVLAGGGLFCFAPGPAAAIEMIRLFQVQRLIASTGQLQSLLELLRGKSALTSLRTVIVSGSRMPIRTLVEAQVKLCPDIWCGYGSTEIGLLTIGLGPVLQRAEGAVGYVTPGVELEIVDEAGGPVPPGTLGVLRARAPNMAFYVDEDGKRVDATQDDGWLYPGDLARVEADGSVVIAGRTGDVINHGGVITAPEVIEEAFRRDPAISDVAAVGVATPAGIDEIWVAVVAATPLDLTQLLNQGRSLLREKAPDRVFQIGAIPRNANAKIQRGVLRDQLLAHAGGTPKAP